MIYHISMIKVMNDQIREEVRVALARANMNQSKLAERIGVSKQYLNTYLRGKAGDIPKLWQAVFDELGLELVVRPKVSNNE
jgi:transcriptional regulator with XRE-family HTH domain